MRPRRIAAALAVAAAAVAAVAVGVAPGIVVEILLALAVTVLAFRLLSAQEGPDPFRAALSRHVPRPHDPHAALARKVAAANTSAADTHRILRPILRAATASRLQRHGIDMDHDQQAAANAVGTQLWELVRPERDRPDADDPGWGRAELAGALERLEQL